MGNGSSTTKLNQQLEPSEVIEPETDEPTNLSEEAELQQQALDELSQLAQQEAAPLGEDETTSWDSGQDLLDAQEGMTQAWQALSENPELFQEEDGSAFLNPESAYDQLGVVAPHAGGVDYGQFEEMYGQFMVEAADGDITPDLIPEWQAELNKATAKWIDAQNNDDLSATEKYEALQEYASTARQLLNDNVEPSDDQWKALKANTRDWLENLSPAELREVAHANGFAHPMLVSGGNPADLSNSNSLAFAMDPAYPDDLPQKQKVQSAALDRFDKLMHDPDIDAVKGVTLDEVLADNEKYANPAPAPTPTPAPTAPLSAEKLAEFQALKQELAHKPPHSVTAEEKWQAAANNAELLAHQDQLTDEELAANLASVHHTHLPPHLSHAPPGVAEKALEPAGLTPDEYQLLDHHEKKAALNAQMLGSQKQAIQQSAKEKSEKAQAAIVPGMSAAAMYEKMEGGKAGKDFPQSQLTSYVQTLSEAHSHLQGGVNYHQMVQTGMFKEAASDLGVNNPAAGFIKDEKGLRDFLKKQPLKALRQSAQDLGMEPHLAKHGSKADIQNYLIGNAHNNALKVKAASTSASHKHAHKNEPSPTPTGNVPSGGEPATPPPTPAPAKKAPSLTKPVYTGKAKANMSQGSVDIGGMYSSDLDSLQSSLKQKLAAHADLPKRDEQSTKALNFTPNQTYAPSGGSHTVLGYQASDGTGWFAKPYGSSGGKPRAAAEATASKAKAALGMDTVPVYHMKVDGKDVAMQPFVTGASNLPSNPVKSMSQTDIDTVVQHQVGDWLIGDHDGNESNWMRSPSGGLFRIDHGQAFKFYGKDQLSPDYSPNGNYGSPVFQQLLTAQSSGNVPSGTTVNPAAAAGAIKRAESIPDAKWRETLRPVAEAGAGNDEIAWSQTMRKRAAKQHGVPESQVSKKQIEDAFLDHAVERKNNLRTQFIKVFEDAGVDASILKNLTK